MEIGFENNYWHPPTSAHAFAAGLGGECGDAPEWLELRARLAAAWSARRELSGCGGSAAGRSGSFDREAASVLVGFDAPSPAVNPIALGNLKSRWGNVAGHTGVSTPGGRG
ncbi:MAG: hypothetical protein ABIM50_13835 [Novosphingobium sp.]